MGAAQADRGVAFLTAAKVLAQSSAAADLIVVGAPRRRGHLGLQLDRVVHALLHHCPDRVGHLPASLS